MTPTEGSVPDVVSLLGQIHTSSGFRYAAVDLRNAFSSRPVNKDHQQCTFTAQPQAYTLQPYISLVHGDLDYLSLPQDSMLFLYTDDITLIKPRQREVATTLD